MIFQHPMMSKMSYGVDLQNYVEAQKIPRCGEDDLMIINLM